MNGLTLRISRGGASKLKNPLPFSAISISSSTYQHSGQNQLIKECLESVSTDEQLAILKKILEQSTVDNEVIRLLVVLFLQAEAKHPVKCFIARHVTKNPVLQQPFTEALATQISSYTSARLTDYKHYLDVVRKIATCIENFTPGVAAIRSVEVQLAGYLKECLCCCNRTLRENSTLSPTEKNQIYNLTHLALRLLLHIIQKSNQAKLMLIFDELRLNINELMRGVDVPMDSKSVCGILYLWMHIIENGPQSWINILNSKNQDMAMDNEATELCLLAAMPTVVPVQELQTAVVDHTPAIVVLVKKLLDIGDRSSSESTFILCITRTIVQISKLLDKFQHSTGVILADVLVSFAWSHLEHSMDSVRHLTVQMLAFVVKYCVNLDLAGDSSALIKLCNTLQHLDRTRKSYFMSLTCLSNELGANKLLSMMPTVIEQGIEALYSQPVQASASTFLDTLLRAHIPHCTCTQTFSSWVQPVLVAVGTCPPHCAVLCAMEQLLVRAVQLDHNVVELIIPYIQQLCDPATITVNLKCILLLLAVVRKSGVTYKLDNLQKYQEEHWKGIISYEVLRQAAVDANDETRILSLSLIVESPKTTEVFTKGDLSFVLWYLRYNINAQAPNFRQLTLSVIKKFLKRYEDSYKVIKRQTGPNYDSNKVEYYLHFIESLRDLCFNSLLPGGNYSRRFVALQVLAWSESMNLEGYNRSWKPEYVERLLLHLEDSYENNKALALDVLCGCDPELIKCKKYSISLDLKDIFEQASSLKPTDCVSAAYKLDLLRRKLPEYVLQEQCDIPEPVRYTLIHKLVSQLQEQLTICEQNIVLAARKGPLYGGLHCVGQLLANIDPIAISSSPQWTSLISELISLCMRVTAAVSCVVNNSSPEGHLPMDMTGLSVTDHGNSGGVLLSDGRPVTAQMVLLCAWRSVKEVSLLLGTITSRLTIAGESSSPCTSTSTSTSTRTSTSTSTLEVDTILRIGEHFTSLLADTKHRGAFEQAYVGFTLYLGRLWRCSNPVLHCRPGTCLRELLQDIAAGDHGTLCPTRRSAGLPFMIQALISTSVQANASQVPSSMLSLLSLSTHCDVTTRTHGLNVLRALFRNSLLQDSLSPYVGDGLLIAIRGFDGDTWAERNSSTLLFSALTVRIFGVTRRRDHELDVRNTMTGRIFFLTYPKLYDFMLDKLKVASIDTGSLRPSVYPVLLLLARLYPSSLEGTVSNLKLVAFIPYVLRSGHSAVLNTRQLAAKAIVPLIAHQFYISHLQSMFNLISAPSIPRNYCHGILLQLLQLLESRNQGQGEDLKVEGLWILEQATGDVPCYVIADEYVKVLNMIVWRFPGLIDQETANKIIQYLDILIFNSATPKITSGRDICLSNAIYLYYVLLHTYNLPTNEVIYKSLQHTSYEVVLSTLNYLLITHNSLDINGCKFQKHLALITKNKPITDDKYIQLLCKILQNDYLECQQKSLKLLTFQKHTQKYIIETKFGNTNGLIVDKLIECIENEHENLTHIYLQSLLGYISEGLKDFSLNIEVMLKVIRVVFECSSSDNNENIRNVVVGFLKNNIGKLLKFDTNGLNEEDKFELKSTVWATIIILLEDDEHSIRQTICDTITSYLELPMTLPSMCGERVRQHIFEEGERETAIALLILVALLDFRSVVVMTDEGNDECRVFDQNERYNIFLEETIWTDACAQLIKHTPNEVINILHKDVFKRTFEKLCGENVDLFVKMVRGEVIDSFVLNPKIALFINRLTNQ